jgi:hypothetical protein
MKIKKQGISMATFEEIYEEAQSRRKRALPPRVKEEKLEYKPPRSDIERMKDTIERRKKSYAK